MIKILEILSDNIQESNDVDSQVELIVKNAGKLNLPAFVKSFNSKIRRDGILKMFIDDYQGDLKSINSRIASRFLNELSNKLGNGYEEVDFANESKDPENHFQMRLYGVVGIIATFVYVDGDHKVVAEKSTIDLVDLRDGDNYFEDLFRF